MKMRMIVITLILTLFAAGCVDMAEPFSSEEALPNNPYIVIVSPISYGKVVPSQANAAFNASIGLTVVPNAGYVCIEGTLKVTSVNDDAEIEVSGGGNSHSFNMPASHVFVSAGFEPVVYSINLGQFINGTITPSHTEASIGEMITLTVAPASGYVLLENTLKILQDNGAPVNLTGYTFTMPASNVTINAQFSRLFNININESGSGNVYVSHESAVEGAPITVNLTPDNGYRVKEANFSISGTDNGTKIFTDIEITEYYIQTHTFSMPAFDITVNVEFEVIPPGVISVYFEGFHDEEMDLTQTGNVIRSGSNDVVTVTVAAGFDSYYWYLDDSQRQEKGNRVTIDSYRLNLGLHTITAVAVKDGIPYSKIVTFMVVK